MALDNQSQDEQNHMNQTSYTRSLVTDTHERDLGDSSSEKSAKYSDDHDSLQTLNDEQPTLSEKQNLDNLRSLDSPKYEMHEEIEIKDVKENSEEDNESGRALPLKQFIIVYTGYSSLLRIFMFRESQ